MISGARLPGAVPALLCSAHGGISEHAWYGTAVAVLAQEAVLGK